MKALDSPAVPARRRAPVALFHPIELAIFASSAVLAHFVLRQSWGAALWDAFILFNFLPRGEIFRTYNSISTLQWSWIVLRWVNFNEVLLLFFAAFWLYNKGDGWLLVVA